MELWEILLFIIEGQEVPWGQMITKAIGHIIGIGTMGREGYYCGFNMSTESVPCWNLNRQTHLLMTLGGKAFG